MTEEMHRTTVRIPKWLRRQVKSKAALMDKTLSDIVREQLERWLKEQEPPIPKEP